MRQRIAALLIVAALPLAATPVAAQGILPFTLGGRMGLAIPVDDFAAHAETGYVTEVLLKASPLPFATLYGGWSFAEFGVDSESAIAGLDTKVRDSGFRAGGELSVPLAGLLSGVSPYLQVGAIFNRAQVRVRGDGTNTLGVKSDRSTGMEVGVGTRVMLVHRLSIVPELRYRSYDPEFAQEPEVQIGDRLSYLALTLALTFHF